MVKVSVIIPVYNSSCYLKQCLESVLRQTLSEIEVIVVDDGSTDDSFSILEKYRLADNRMKLIHFDKNTGVSHARNTGIGIAEGKYLYFLDSDDWIDDDYLDSMFLKAETTGQKVICNSSFVVEHECEGANIGHFWIKKGFEGFLNPSYVTSYSIPSLWVRLFEEIILSIIKSFSQKNFKARKTFSLLGWPNCFKNGLLFFVVRLFTIALEKILCHVAVMTALRILEHRRSFTAN